MHGAEAGQAVDGPAVVGQHRGLAEAHDVGLRRGHADEQVEPPPLGDLALDRLEPDPLIARCRTVGARGRLEQTERTELVGGIAGEKRHTILVRHQDALAGSLPGALQRIELDAHDRHAEQGGIADRFGEVVADPVVRGLDAEVAALGRGDRFAEDRMIGEVTPDQRVGGIPVVARHHDAVRPDDEHRARVGLAAEPHELAIEPLDPRHAHGRIGRRFERGAHVGIEREHDRQVILPADLRLDGIGDQLHARLVHRLQRLEAVLTPDMLRYERGDRDRRERAGEQASLSQPTSHHEPSGQGPGREEKRRSLHPDGEGSIAAIVLPQQGGCRKSSVRRPGELTPRRRATRPRRGRVRCRSRSARPRAYAGSADRLWRSGMFFSRSSLGMRRLTSNFPFSTRLM